MKRFAILSILILIFRISFAQETVQISNVILKELDNNLLSITVEIQNVSDKSISEVAGYIDIYDNSERVVEKKQLNIVHVYDVPMEPGSTRSRKAIITQRPNMSGTARFRITHLRFFGEKEEYIICPYCGELILKEE